VATPTMPPLMSVFHVDTIVTVIVTYTMYVWTVTWPCLLIQTLQHPPTSVNVSTTNMTGFILNGFFNTF